MGRGAARSGGRSGTRAGSRPKAGAGASAGSPGSSALRRSTQFLPAAPLGRNSFQRVPLDHLRCPSPDTPPPPSHPEQSGNPGAEEGGAPGSRLRLRLWRGQQGIAGLFVEQGEAPVAPHVPAPAHPPAPHGQCLWQAPCVSLYQEAFVTATQEARHCPKARPRCHEECGVKSYCLRRSSLFTPTWWCHVLPSVTAPLPASELGCIPCFLI